MCYYCGTNLEKILHLFWECNYVQEFWVELSEFFFDNALILVPLDKNKILFGVQNEKPDSIVNTIILVAKQYIWRNKFNETHTSLSLVAFRRILKYKIEEFEIASQILKNNEFFERWNNVYRIL